MGFWRAGVNKTPCASSPYKNPYLHFMNRFKFILANIAWLLALSLLLSSSELLSIGLDSDGKLPLGTLITWWGFIGLAYVSTRSISILRMPNSIWEKSISVLGTTGFYAACIWPLLGWLLAGNLSFEFTSAAPGFRGSPEASVWFWDLNYAIPIVCLIAFITGGATMLLRRFRGKQG